MHLKTYYEWSTLILQEGYAHATRACGCVMLGRQRCILLGMRSNSGVWCVTLARSFVPLNHALGHCSNHEKHIHMGPSSYSHPAPTAPRLPTD